MELTDSEQHFILHWGEMGSRWGITRAAAQVHALLLISSEPLHAEEICETLRLARSNVSVALRELQNWGIVKLSHRIGSRKEHFIADKNAWNFLAEVAEKRIQKELIPALEILQKLQEDKGISPTLLKLCNELVETIEGGISFFRRMRGFPVPLAKRLLRLDKKITNILQNRGRDDG